jgi:hypothetical protein
VRESVCIFVVDLSGGFWDVFGRLFLFIGLEMCESWFCEG